jgi:hypothetical protein
VEPAPAPAPAPVAAPAAGPTGRAPAAPATSSRLATTASAIIGLWGLGTLGLEGVEQAAAGAALLMALATLRRVRLAEDLRLFAYLTVALAAYQALSPLLALALGTSPELPRSGRWTQALETLAPLSLAVVSTFGVPWRLLFWGLGVGWMAELAVGVFQRLVAWPWESWGPYKFPLHRLHQNYAPESVGVRRPALGLFFHKLKFAHEALAFLAPRWRSRCARALAPPRLAGGFSALLLVCTYSPTPGRRWRRRCSSPSRAGGAAAGQGPPRRAAHRGAGGGDVTLSPVWKVRPTTPSSR